MMEVAEPAVIDEELIRKAIVPPPTPEGAALPPDKREEVKREIELHQVETLMFSFCNVLKIDNLVGLDNLVKLQLDNNIIQRIENLHHLTNLQWLDLSFNNIAKIENLHTLTKLTDLSLYSNQIVTLENLDTLIHLNVLSIGKNEIKSLENLLYLRRFQNLRLLNCSDNHVSHDAEYRAYVIAHVKGLQYLDYRLVEEAAVQSAREQYQDELMDLEEREGAERDAKEKLLEHKAKHSKYAEANLEGIETLHDDIFRDDPEISKLSMLSFWSDIMDEHKEHTQENATDFIRTILSQYKSKQQERVNFKDAMFRSHSKIEETAIALIRQYEVKKKKTFRELKLDAQENIRRLKDLRASCEVLSDELMELELQQCEEEQAINLEFERLYQELLTTTTEQINGFFQKMRTLEEIRNEKANLLATDEMEKFANNMLEDVTESAAALLQDKEALMNSLTSSHDLHVNKLEAKEDEMISVETRIFQNLLQEARESSEKRNRDRITEVSMFCERNLREVDDAIANEEDQ